ncbi:two-component system regulatory protein YycI [Lactiplantibacillus songbeiensis]|uniref:Two-component system regulatory protein YycI n=1 Tax=Lactiplantibacillus songbeiensis TaxID=2559920 RepID=A0ABW4BY91_9LACO|nr:two-component system regulatory protein YycI [Lactiplantibacillus songbeiensis]
MNFRRIEWIFLVAFVVLDVFLVYMFVQTSSSDTSTKSTNDTTTTVIREMRDDNISFSTPSGKENNGYYIAGNNDSGLKAHLNQLTDQSTRVLSNGKITSTLRTSVTVDPDHPEKTLDQYVKSATNVIHGDEYVYSAELSSSSDYVYVQKVADGKILTGTGQLHLTINKNHQLIGYTQGYVNNVKTLREKAVTISEKKALVALYQYNQVSNDSRIVWGRLGYSRLLKLKDSSVYVPTWVFAVRSKNSSNISLHRINAFTGAAMKANTANTASSDTTDGDVAAGMIWNAE